MIDAGMGHEAAAEWLPKFVAVAQMTPSHPLRAQAASEAEDEVLTSFAACVWTETIGAWASNAEQAREAAGDVIEVLWGCAALIVAGEFSSIGSGVAA